MGCQATSQIIAPSISNLDHRLVALVAAGKTNAIIQLLEQYDYEIDINSSINFKGDTLLHYACFKNNKKLVEYLIGRKEILKTTKNYQNKIARDLTTHQDIQNMCS